MELIHGPSERYRLSLGHSTRRKVRVGRQINRSHDVIVEVTLHEHSRNLLVLSSEKKHLTYVVIRPARRLLLRFSNFIWCLQERAGEFVIFYTPRQETAVRIFKRNAKAFSLNAIINVRRRLREMIFLEYLRNN